MNFTIDLTNKTLNGCIYPVEVLKEAVKNYQADIVNEKAFVFLDAPVSGMIDLSMVCGKISKLENTGTVLTGEFDFIGLKRDLAKNLYDLKLVELTLSGIGTVGFDGEISNYELIGLFFTRDSAIQK